MNLKNSARGSLAVNFLLISAALVTPLFAGEEGGGGGTFRFIAKLGGALAVGLIAYAVKASETNAISKSGKMHLRYGIAMPVFFSCAVVGMFFPLQNLWMQTFVWKSDGDPVMGLIFFGLLQLGLVLMLAQTFRYKIVYDMDSVHIRTLFGSRSLTWADFGGDAVYKEKMKTWYVPLKDGKQVKVYDMLIGCDDFINEFEFKTPYKGVVEE